nr:efflux RND transporter periplasmic adaptor subunit [Clostridium cibarium]
MKGGNEGGAIGFAGASTVLIVADQGNLDKTVKITPNNDGTIQNLNLKVGDSVRIGQAFFVSNSDTVRQNVDKAQANLDKQNSTLLDLKNSTRLQIDNLDISDAQNQLNSAKNAVNKMTVTSPISGVIAAVNKSNGDSVGVSSGSSQSNISTSISGANSNESSSTTQSSAGKSSGTTSGSNSAGSISSSTNASSSSSNSSTSTDVVLTIVDPSSMKVKVSVDELDIAKIKEGQKAEIKFDAIGDKVYEGTVESIPQTGTTTNGVTKYDVSVSINDSTGIKIGMSANVNILVDSKDNALAVPADAVIEKDRKKYVIDESNNLIEVKTGIENENYIEILDGVKEDEKLLETK